LTGAAVWNRITLVSYQTGPTDSFSYYLDGELNQATLGNLGHTLTYNLDKMGNRTSVVDNNVPSIYTPNTINQYTTAAGSSVADGPEHEIQSYNGVTYLYINDERLESAATSAGFSPGGVTYAMVYDALGRCVKRSLTGGPTTYYIYDGEKPILEYDGGGASVGTNLYGKGIDELLERVAIGSDGQWHVYYPQQNHEGSVTLLTDTGGNVIERYRYDAFGAPTIYDANWNARSNTIYDNRFLFTGREYAATYRSTYITPAFAFYEYRARAYHPGLGRFMSEDPKLFDAGDYNLFRYCHNDPIDFTDPMGTVQDRPQNPEDHAATARALDNAYNFIMGLMQRQFSSAISAGMAGYAYSQAWSALQQESKLAGQIKAQIYGKNGAISPRIERGITKVFGPMSILVPSQTRENAPFLDTSYNSNEVTGMAVTEAVKHGHEFEGRATGFNALPTVGRPNGTIFIARDVGRFLRSYPFERTYVHELSNILSYRLTRSESTFGSARFIDTDTGRNVEDAVFGSR
jgi:RHS repeat-associated protein